MPLFMIVERFRPSVIGGEPDPVPIYRRFRERGRLAPEGLNYISSWVDHDLSTCYQLMEVPESDADAGSPGSPGSHGASGSARRLLDQWIANWSDIVDFEVIPVITSKEAAERVAALEARLAPRPGGEP